MICIAIAVACGWCMETQRRHHEVLTAIASSSEPSTPSSIYENPLDRIKRQTLINGSYGEAMTRAREVSIENHDRWYVMEDTKGFSAVPLCEWVAGGRKLIAVFDDGWQLPDK